MKNKTLNLVNILLIALCFTSCCKDEAPLNKTDYSTIDKNGEQTELLVLELFTSEGCSDCPPAEEALGEIVRYYSSKNQNVVAIAEHVDYWNDLIMGEEECNGNWVDIFSDGYYTQRQFRYAEKNNDRPATPQVYLNGNKLSGSTKKDSVDKLIEENKGVEPNFKINLSLAQTTDFTSGLLDIEFTLTKNPNSKSETKVAPQLQLYLVESNVVSKPDKGENCGSTLHHTNVARSFATKTLRSVLKGNVKLQIPSGVKLENCSVIGLIQNIYNHDIIGGTNGFSFTK